MGGVNQSTIDALEHESGLRPLGEYPDHCDRCRRVAGCEHEDRTEHSSWGGGVFAAFCSGCGIQLPVDAP